MMDSGGRSSETDVIWMNDWPPVEWLDDYGVSKNFQNVRCVANLVELTGFSSVNEVGQI